jgi:hypothetical protein
VLVPISDGTRLDRSQKGFIELTPDSLVSVTQPTRSGAIACPASNTHASNSCPILSASRCRGNAIAMALGKLFPVEVLPQSASCKFAAYSTSGSTSSGKR